MVQVVWKIFLETTPIILMIVLIPLVQNDFILAGFYVGIIVASFAVKREKHDTFFLLFGLIVLFFSEYFFISTGVEVFERVSLLGIMPVWLPILWGYAFVAIKRGILILNSALQ